MNGIFLTSMSRIFLEANKDESPMETEDYSVDIEEPEMEMDEDTNEENTKSDTSDTSDENIEEDPSMDEADDYSVDVDDPEVEEDTNGEEDMGEDEDLNDENIDDQSNENNYKKYMLLKGYKALSSDILRLITSTNILVDNLDRDLVKHGNFIQNKLNSLKEKIDFVLRNEFLPKSYEELLTSYLYFNEELNAILELLEKIIKYNNQ